MEEIRRFRISWKPVLLLTVVAALAVNVPASWFGAKTEETRRATVFSDFVNLTADAGEGGFDFLGTVAELSGQDARIRERRRAHILPGLLASYAGRIGMPEDWMRGAILDPDYAHPFDISAFEVTGPGFARHGVQGNWRWGLATSGTEDLSPDDADVAWCARWLVVWNDVEWFYAPVGSNALDDMLRAAAPDLARVQTDDDAACDRRD